MAILDLHAHRWQATSMGAVADSLPWESGLRDLAHEDPDFIGAAVVVIDGDLDAPDADLHLDNLYPEDPDHPLPFLLLVRGSLRVRAVLNTDFDGGTHLVVLGDLHAEVMITVEQETFVSGNLLLRRMWWGIGEAGRLMVRGLISAPALVADGYGIDDDRIRRRRGVTTTAFLWSDGTDHLPREHVRCVFADALVEDDLDEDDEANFAGDWVDVTHVLDAIDAGEDPFTDPVTNPAVDLFVPEPDLLGSSANELFTLFQNEVSPEALAAVLTDPVIVEECETYDDDLIDRDRKYSVRQAGPAGGARLTIMRVLSDPEQLYRFHHFEARETASGAVQIELLTQGALGTEQDVVPVDPHDIDRYIDALSCFRRLRAFLAETA